MILACTDTCLDIHNDEQVLVANNSRKDMWLSGITVGKWYMCGITMQVRHLFPIKQI
jgi:hypothetical protein